MTFPKNSRPEESKPAATHRQAPMVHMDALLQILDNTDRSINILTKAGMDNRAAAILTELEKSDCVVLRTDKDGIFVDVVDKKRALAVLDGLTKDLGLKL